MAQQIFISYRRDDSRGWARGLHAALADRYGPEHVFRDVVIPPGTRYAVHLNELLDHCKVVLAIIGPHWLDAHDRDGQRRLDDPDDWVRLELERPLKRTDVEVIPVLVDGAQLPPEEQLPAALRPLRERQAFELTDRHFDADVSELTTYLDEVLKGTSAEHVRRPELELESQPEPPPPPPDRTGAAVLAASTAAVLTAFPAYLIARSVVDRPPLTRDATAIADFVLEKAILFGITAAVAGFVAALVSRHASQPSIAFMFGLGVGILSGIVYAGAYAGWKLSGAEGSDAASTALGMIAAGAFLGWGFGGERRGSRVEAACAGLGGGLLAGALVAMLHGSLTSTDGQGLLSGLSIAVIVAAASFVGLRTPRSVSAPELLRPARAAPPAMHR